LVHTLRLSNEYSLPMLPLLKSKRIIQLKCNFQLFVALINRRNFAILITYG
jgi:hypothetical protein